MSVRVGLLPPTFTNSRVWITRSSFACNGIDSSLISSMNSVPVCASAKNPVRCSTAPVKLPRTCPKRWLSISPSGIAVQSSVTSGRSHRALCAWIARAISSLPVPDSPEMHTFASPGATFSIFASTSPSCADCPTSPCAPAPPRGALAPRPPSPSRLTTRSSAAVSSASPAGRSSHCTPASAGAAPSWPPAPSTTTGLSSPSPRSRCPSSHAVSGGCRFTTVSAGRPCACTACSSSCNDPTKCGSQPQMLASPWIGADSSIVSSSTRTFTVCTPRRICATNGELRNGYAIEGLQCWRALMPN